MPKIEYRIPVLFIKEGDSFIAYSPAIDVSTVGDSHEEAQKRFEEASQLFFEEIIEKGTAKEALLELGWQSGKKLTPPVIVSHQSIPVTVANALYA